MNRIRNAHALLILGILIMSACASQPIPESSVTGQIFEVRISDESVTPKAVTMKRGDEVRWINTTKGFVDVSFMQSLSDIALCRKGFRSTGWDSSVVSTSGIRYLFLARIDSNKHASLCLSLPGTYQYAVEMDEATTGKATRMHGTVTIE